MDQQAQDAPSGALGHAPRMRGGERFRGSSEIPLAPQGLQEATDVGISLARRGGVDEIKSSDLGRAMQTAHAISRFTHAPITYAGPGLHPWHLGHLEGTPVTDEKIDFINHLIRHEPDRAVEGRGPTSTLDGESFNSFRQRTIDFLQDALRQSASMPNRRIALVTHYRVKKLLDAWMRKGAQRDGTIDPDVMTQDSGDHKTAGVSRIVNDQYAGPQEFDVDLDSPASLPGGLYVIRHGMTAYNNQQS